MSWLGLREETEGLLSRTKDTLKNAIEDKQKKEVELAKALSQLPLMREKTTSLLDAMNGAELARARFQATQALLQESLLITLEKDRKPSDPNRFDILLNKTLISVKTFSLVDERLDETSTDKSISELLALGLPFRVIATAGLGNNNDPSETAKTILRNLKGDAKQVTVVLQDPGITVTILGLLQDLARAEEERVRVEISYGREVVGLLEGNISFLEKYESRLRDDLSRDRYGVVAAMGLARDVNDTVGRTLASFGARCQASSLRGESQACLNLRALYGALEFNYNNRVNDALKIDQFETRLAELESGKVLETVRVNVLEREAAISRGLDGLLAFHQGGIDENDVRNIIAIAQAIGVMVIAGGVY